jgi:hypothetical protein
MSQGLPMRPVPADFAKWAKVETNEQLKVRYCTGSGALARWRNETGIHGKGRKGCRPTNYKPTPADFAELAPTMTRRELMHRFGIGDFVLKRWLHEARTDYRAEEVRSARVRAARSRPAAHYGSHKNYVLDSRDGGIHSRAQSFLQRIGPVFRCTETGQPSPRGSHFMVWGRVLTPDDMMERAKRRGFDSDEWRRAA